MLEVAAALIVRDGKFLLCQRPETKARGLLWELPGGKLEPGETGAQAAARECREELGVRLQMGPLRVQLQYTYPDVTIHLAVYEASLSGGTPQALEHRALRWVTVHEALAQPLCPADRLVLEQLVTKENCKEDA